MRRIRPTNAKTTAKNHAPSANSTQLAGEPLFARRTTASPASQHASAAQSHTSHEILDARMASRIGSKAATISAQFA